MATELLKKRCQASCRSQCSWQPPFCVFLGKNVSCLLPACELMRGKVSSVAPGFLPELSRLGFWQWKGQRLAPFTGGGGFSTRSFFQCLAGDLPSAPPPFDAAAQIPEELLGFTRDIHGNTGTYHCGLRVQQGRIRQV